MSTRKKLNPEQESQPTTLAGSAPYLVLLACLAATTTATRVRAADGDNVPPKGFTALFNGKDLSGWYGLKHFDPRKLWAMSDEERAEKREKDLVELNKHWRVEDGEIVNDGHGPYLTTERHFGDVELIIDYKTVAKADSGIYLRANPQVQIWDWTREGGKWDRARWGSGGLFNNSAGAPGQRPLVFADNPFGEWNRFHITQVGSRTTVLMNGKVVVDHEVMENYWDRNNPLWTKGPIQLQTHGGEIRWKNLFVREIPPEEANAYLARKNRSGFIRVFDGQSLAGWKGAVDNYEVTDGALACKKGSGGTLFTEEVYDDFAVRLEFKLPPGGNNGLSIRYPGTGHGTYDAMTELQVLDNTAAKYAKLDQRQYHGSAYGMVPAKRGFLRPVGEWNFQEVIVRGSTIQVELNGTPILDADLSKVTEFMNKKPAGLENAQGHFGFAGHSDPVQFRHIYIKRL